MRIAFALLLFLLRLPLYRSVPVSQARRVFGVAVCLLALFAASGGHWTVLQTIAWSRMLVEYSRDATLAEAARDTFSGKRPCALCKKIREGRQQEENRTPLLKWERLPEFVPGWQRATVPIPPASTRHLAGYVPHLSADFFIAPPKPVPRCA